MNKTKPIIADAIELTADALVLTVRGKRRAIPWRECSQRLAAATTKERMTAELSPGGYGIHWPLIDEDLSVGGLMQKRRT